MAQDSEPQGGVVQFLRQRDYTLVKELGEGACGKTVLLHDPQIDEEFVCKKYAPQSEEQRQELFSAFVREVKLLYKIHHVNVVRVFNWYLYPEQLTGYILMEYVDGSEVDDYLRSHPEQVNEVFHQTITGFAYLQRTGILHRDVRPGNVMVGADGTVKIIDLGFGKEIRSSGDFEKSISLNWWCQTPNEFSESRYDFCSEVYFVGKLFEKIVRDNGIDHFKNTSLLGRMCHRDPATRIQSFSDIEREMGNDQFSETEFSEGELASYRAFADAVCAHVARIGNGTKYVDDAGRIRSELDKVYRTVMLEEHLPDAAAVLRCLLAGTFSYRPQRFPVTCLKDFLQLLRSSTGSKKRIILANLHTRLDAVSRFSKEEMEAAEHEDDDIPF